MGEDRDSRNADARAPGRAWSSGQIRGFIAAPWISGLLGTIPFSHVNVREPIRHAMRLAGHFVGGRAFSILTLALAAWALPITAFAEFGVYITIVNLAWIGLFLRFEQAIVSADDVDADAAFRLSAFVGSVVWAIAAAASLMAWLLGVVPGFFAAFLPVALAVRGVTRLAIMSATRAGDFPGLGRMALAHGFIQPPALLAAVVLLENGALCLLVADLVGNTVAAVAILSRQWGAVARALVGPWAIAELRASARTWSALPALNLPGSMLGLAFTSAPLLVTPLLAEPEFAGQVALAMRIFDVPTQIVAAATTPVLLNRLRPGPARPGGAFGRRLLVGFALAMVAIYGASAAGLLLIDPWFEGTQLAKLADVVPVVALFHAVIAVTGPLVEGCGLYRAQGPLSLIHLCALAVTVVVLGAGLGGLLTPQGALWALVLTALARGFAVGEQLRTLSLASRS